MKMNNKVTAYTGLYAAIVLVMLNFAYAAPVMPTLYSGKVTNQGISVVNPNVYVVDEGDMIVSSSRVSDDQGEYTLYVWRDDESSPSDEGVSDGESIRFYVNTYLVKTVTIGQPGVPYTVNLDMTGVKTERRLSGGGSPEISFEVFEPPTYEEPKKGILDFLRPDPKPEEPGIPSDKIVENTEPKEAQITQKSSSPNRVDQIQVFVDKERDTIASTVVPILALLVLVVILVIVFRKLKKNT